MLFLYKIHFDIFFMITLKYNKLINNNAINKFNNNNT